MSVFKINSVLLISLVTLANGAELFRRQDSQAFDFIPSFGFGEDCTDSFGENYEWCGPEDARYCYDPTIGDICCFDKEDPWACPKGSFCLVDGFCCPDGLDPTSCAADEGVSLPADFSIDSNNNNNNDADADAGIIDVDEVSPATGTFVGTIPPSSEATAGIAYVQFHLFFFPSSSK